MTISLCAAVVAAAAPNVLAHEGDHPIEQLSFDRPESWALKYFASATLLTGLETPRTRTPGSLLLGVEVAWLPPLSEAKRFVGFDGTKPEDLNKLPLFLRPRVTIGLPARFSVIVAADPPIHSFGVTPRLFALAVERPVYEAERWAVGLRGYGQTGTVKGAYTCPANVLQFTPGSPGNLYGCQAESSDTATLHFAGGELSVARRPATGGRLSPHVAVSVNYLDLAFQVNALTFGFVDSTHLLSHGVTFAASGGITYALARRIDASIDAFYTPLSVQRPVTGGQNNALFNVRALLAYRLR
jgi:hypothetical protein